MLAGVRLGWEKNDPTTRGWNGQRLLERGQEQGGRAGSRAGRLHKDD